MLYLEDFAVGQKFGSGRLKVDAQRIKSFAAEFDPQPFHLDDAAARGTIFGGLAASGWHTAAMTMRLLVESELKPAGGIVGAGFDEFRWPAGTAGGRAAPGHRGDGGAAVQIAAGAGIDQGEDHHRQPERRAGAGVGGQPRRAATTQALISDVTGRRRAEIAGLNGGAMIAAMGTQDYWIYSVGLVFLTFLVLIA